MAMEFSVWDERLPDGAHVVSVRGEIDLFTAPEFKQRVSAAIDGGAELVVVDLSATTFIDSSSLGVLITAQRRLSGRDGRLVIACDVPAVMSTFRITGLDTVLELAPDRETALAGSGSAAA